MRISQDGVVGVVCIIFALILIFVWIPLDVESGIIEKIRSRKSIGDAMAPTMAGVLLLLSGSLLLLSKGKGQSASGLSWTNVKFVTSIVLGTIIILLVMRWAGPAMVSIAKALGSELDNYRSLRDTAPWKYIGFISGGTLAIFLLISFAERRLKPSRFVISFLLCTAIAFFYGIPFDDLLLPPNGDV